MKTIDIFRTAMTNLRRQKLRSALTTFAIVIGAASVTIMLTLVTSAQTFATAQATGNGQDSQVAVSPMANINFNDVLQGQGYDPQAGSSTKIDDAMLQRIGGVNNVTSVVPLLFPQVFAQSQVDGKTMDLRGGAVSYGTQPGITHQMVAGTWVNQANALRTISVSAGMASSWGFGSNPQALVGKQIKLITKNWYQGPGSGALERMNAQSNQPGNNGGGPQDQSPTTFDVTITGVTSEGDNNIIYPSWAWGNELSMQVQGSKNGPSTYVSQVASSGYAGAIAVVNSPNNVDAAAKAIAGLGLGTATAKQAVDKQQQAFRILGFVLGGIGAIALLVAAIGVINTMLMSVLERTREIGVMRALGASRKTVRRLFTFEAGTLGLFGGILGVLIGFVLSLIANPIVNEQLKKKALSARDIISVPPLLAIGVIVVTTIIGLLAGLIPAARAARMDPVEALRAD